MAIKSKISPEEYLIDVVQHFLCLPKNFSLFLEKLFWLMEAKEENFDVLTFRNEVPRESFDFDKILKDGEILMNEKIQKKENTQETQV